jgi:hypothetical protein
MFQSQHQTEKWGQVLVEGSEETAEQGGTGTKGENGEISCRQ